MENEILKEIIAFASRKLNSSYGYCGVAEGKKAALLNCTDKQGNEIKIKITIEDSQG